jgi:hypothetical protein
VAGGSVARIDETRKTKFRLGCDVQPVGVGLAMAGLLQPVFSAFAMVASSIFVTTNAMKMNKFPLLKMKKI